MSSFEDDAAMFAAITAGMAMDPVDLMALAALAVDKHRFVLKKPRKWHDLLVAEWVPAGVSCAVLQPVEECTLGFLASIDYDPVAMPLLFEETMALVRAADGLGWPMVPYARVTQGLMAANEYLLAVPEIAERPVVMRPAFRRSE